MLSYAGYPLVWPTEEIEAIETRLSEVPPVRAPAAAGLPDWLWQFVPRLRDRPHLNTLYWPCWGASRWAEGLFVVDGATLTSLRAVCFVDGSPVAQTWRFDDGTTAVETELYMLPAVPLAQPDPSPGSLWLVPLVDRRYFWWHTTQVADLGGDVATWEDLYASLADALGLDLTVDDIDPGFLYPSPQYVHVTSPLPPLLDATAAAAGQRVTFALDGGVRAMNADDSVEEHAANIDAWLRLAGGTVSSAYDGGTGDSPAAVPTRVGVAFPRLGSSDPNHTEYAALADLIDDDDTLDELYGPVDGSAGCLGDGGDRVFRSLAYAEDAAYPPTNLAELTALTAAVAKAHYKHLAARADLLVPGAAEWSPEGLAWELEYRHRGDELATRVRRPPGEVAADILAHAGSGRYDVAFTHGGFGLTLEDGTSLLLEDGTSLVSEQLVLISYGPGSSILYAGPNITYTAHTTVTIDESVFLTYEGGGASSLVVWNVPTEITNAWIWTSTTIPLTSTTVNNLTITDKPVIRLTTTDVTNAVTFLTGIVPRDPTQSQTITVVNDGPGTVGFVDESGSSTTTNRFDTPDGSTLFIGDGDSATINYNPATQRWSFLTTTSRPVRPYTPTITTVPATGYVVPFTSTALIPVLGSAKTLPGIVGVPVGATLLVTNPKSNSHDLTLTNGDTGPSSGDRFAFSSGADVGLSPGSSLLIVNDGTKLTDVAGSLSTAAGSAGWTVGTVAAAGSTQGDAAALAYWNNDVTGADSVKGVLLSASFGMQAVDNRDLLNGIKVYPPSGGQINALGANNPYTHPLGSRVAYWRFSATQWYTQSLS